MAKGPRITRSYSLKKNRQYPCSVQSSSVTQSCPTLWNPMNCSTPGLAVHHQLSESTQTHVHWVGDAIQPSHPLSPPSPPPPIPPSIRVFSNDSALRIRWPKYWSFSFSISSSNEHPGLSPLGWTGWISLHSKGLSRVFTVQISHPYMTTEKTIALTRRINICIVKAIVFSVVLCGCER